MHKGKSDNYFWKIRHSRFHCINLRRSSNSYKLLYIAADNIYQSKQKCHQIYIRAIINHDCALYFHTLYPMQPITLKTYSTLSDGCLIQLKLY